MISHRPYSGTMLP